MDQRQIGTCYEPSRSFVSLFFGNLAHSFKVVIALYSYESAETPTCKNNYIKLYAGLAILVREHVAIIPFLFEYGTIYRHNLSLQHSDQK